MSKSTAVFYIGSYDIVDPSEFQKYPPIVMALLPKYGGVLLASDTSAFLVEGTARTMNAIIRFPSKEAALGLYNDAVSGSKTNPAGVHKKCEHGSGRGISGGGLGRASPGPADDSYLPALSSSAEELIAAIGLEPRHAHSGRHLELLQDFSRPRIDSPDIALATFRGAVPELSVDPGHAGDEAI